MMPSKQAVDPEVEQVLGETNADLRRTNDALGLTVRHAHVRDNGGRAPDIENEALAADLALARDLLDNPPRSVGFSADGPVAVAASAVELHLSSRAPGRGSRSGRGSGVLSSRPWWGLRSL